MYIKKEVVFTVLCAKSLQSCLTLCDPMDCSLPGSSVHGVLQARILEWVAISSSRESSWPRDQTRLLHILYSQYKWLKKVVILISSVTSENNLAPSALPFSCSYVCVETYVLYVGFSFCNKLESFTE